MKTITIIVKEFNQIAKETMVTGTKKVFFVFCGYDQLPGLINYGLAD
jgi:hypothetical protein